MSNESHRKPPPSQPECFTGEVPMDGTAIAQRRDAALRRALNTPPQPKHGKAHESKQQKPRNEPKKVRK
jgi:hypothetical protein